MAKSGRNYSDRTLKILWGRAAGRCSVPTCRIEVFVDANEHDPIVIIAEIAHIEAASDKGPRANLMLCKKERDEYENLILLCSNCHRRFDGQKKSNTVESIQKLKQDHEAWVRASLPERGKSSVGWIGLFVQGEHPVDFSTAEAALSPDFLVHQRELVVEPSRKDWSTIAVEIQSYVQTLFQSGDRFDSRFAVFPLAPVSACIAIGYFLTSRPLVRLFEYGRDDHVWSWSCDSVELDEIFVEGLPTERVETSGDLALCFHLSADIGSTCLDELDLDFVGRVHIRLAKPRIGWLTSVEHLKLLAKRVRECMGSCRRLYPNSTTWHVFYAGPAPGAVLVGQQANPTMIPNLQLYEYNQKTAPQYTASIKLRT